MKNPANFKQRKRKRINSEKSIFSSSQKVLFLGEDKKLITLNKPPFNYGKTDEEILHAVIAELAIYSNPINFDKIS